MSLSDQVADCLGFGFTRSHFTHSGKTILNSSKNGRTAASKPQKEEELPHLGP